MFFTYSHLYCGGRSLPTLGGAFRCTVDGADFEVGNRLTVAFVGPGDEATIASIPAEACNRILPTYSLLLGRFGLRKT